MQPPDKLRVGDTYRFVSDGSVWLITASEKNRADLLSVSGRPEGTKGHMVLSPDSPAFATVWAYVGHDTRAPITQRSPVPEAPCGTCDRKNDVGAGKCWWCEREL